MSDDVLIVDPDIYDLSYPRALFDLRNRVNPRAKIVLWENEAETSAGVNYIKYHRFCARRSGAREFDIAFIESDDANRFYEATHLQGSCNAHIHVALVNDDEIAACMSFGPPHVCRAHEAHFLLQRFSTNGAVAGAASRLLSAFRSKHQGSILTFSDNRYSVGGEIYRRLGFEKLHDVRPDYRYRRDGRWFAKSSKQRRHLLKEGATPNTERRMAEELGYRRCYDLGKKAWICLEHFLDNYPSGA